MLCKRKKGMVPIPIKHCMGGEKTVMMKHLLDTPEEMLGKGRTYVRHTLKPGVTIGSHTREHKMETITVLSGHARHMVNREEQFLEPEGIIGAMPGDTHEITCVGDEDLVVTAQVLYE